MHLEVKRSFGIRNGKKRTRPALYIVGTDAGGVKRGRYIRADSAFLVEFLNRAPLPPGRPPTYPEEVKAIFRSCGYNINGARISMVRARYFLASSAESRFAMLSDDDKIRVGSAETLLSLEKQAYSLLKRANVKRIPRRYSDCLREVITGAQSVTSAKAHRANTPPAPA